MTITNCHYVNGVAMTGQAPSLCRLRASGAELLRRRSSCTPSTTQARSGKASLWAPQATPGSKGTPTGMCPASSLQSGLRTAKRKRQQPGEDRSTRKLSHKHELHQAQPARVQVDLHAHVRVAHTEHLNDCPGFVASLFRWPAKHVVKIWALVCSVAFLFASSIYPLRAALTSKGCGKAFCLQYEAVLCPAANHSPHDERV